jgi:hypothetical protein
LNSSFFFLFFLLFHDVEEYLFSRRNCFWGKALKDNEAIPEEMAAHLCSEVRKEKGVRIFSQCWGCIRFSKGDPGKMCFSSRPDNRGCGIVNKRFDMMHPSQ